MPPATRVPKSAKAGFSGQFDKRNASLTIVEPSDRLQELGAIAVPQLPCCPSSKRNPSIDVTSITALFVTNALLIEEVSVRLGGRIR